MTRRIVLALAMGCLVGCRGAGQSSAPDGRDFPHVADTIDRNAPSIADLEAFTYSDTDAGTVTLDGGTWRGVADAGSSSGPEVVLVKGFRLTGDITGNGTDEAVVLLESRRPPAAPRVYLAVVGWIGGQLVNIATTPLGDRVQVKGGHTELGRIVLDGVRREPEGQLSPPAAPVSLVYALEGRTLRLISGDSAAAPPASAQPPTLSGTSWKLVQFQSMGDKTLKPQPGAAYALSFEAGEMLLVQADCDRGWGRWRSPGASGLQMGPLAMSRATCPSPIHDRFVRDLADVRSYVIKGGQLFLSLQTDAGIYELTPSDRPIPR